jgi:hypothetical protein
MTAWKVTLLATQWLLLSVQSAPSQKCLTFTASIPPHCLSTARFPLAYQQLFLPPKEFDRDYNGHLKIEHMRPDEIDRQCGSAVKPGNRALACARRADIENCTIYIMFENYLRELGWNYEIVFRHERGHCLGWHHD